MTQLRTKDLIQALKVTPHTLRIWSRAKAKRIRVGMPYTKTSNGLVFYDAKKVRDWFRKHNKKYAFDFERWLEKRK